MANDHIADDRKKVRLIDSDKARVVAQRIYSDPVLIHVILNTLNHTPTVDAVEVVRCAKCKHYQQYHKDRTEELCEWGKCKLISMDVDMPCNGFCCFGERKTITEQTMKALEAMDRKAHGGE